MAIFQKFIVSQEEEKYEPFDIVTRWKIESMT